MKLQPTDEVMSVLEEIAELKNMDVVQVSEKVLELYSSKYLKMIRDAKSAAQNAVNRYDG